MPKFKILYDEPHEADWFRALHHDFQTADEESITNAKDWPILKAVLAYDRPDIILLDHDVPVLVIEETVEVPSGHNVGQRFARIAAAAEANVPCLYFGPYVAKKHGGVTSGPRYMNVRLFKALDAMTRITGTSITTINWPIDRNYEVRRDREKDNDVREYIETFISLYYSFKEIPIVNLALIQSPVCRRMIEERNSFVATEIRNPEQYNTPPDSVEFLSAKQFSERFNLCLAGKYDTNSEFVLYCVGMTYIRSDPYTGMAMLYRYLYIAEHPTRKLILWFPNIESRNWIETAANGRRKDIRLFRIAADGIIFSDSFLSREEI